MITLNLLGPQPATMTGRQRLVWAGLVTLTVAMFLGHVAQSRQLAGLSLQVEKLKSEAAQLSSRVAMGQRKARANADLAARLRLIEKLGRHRGRALGLLAAAGNALSPSMWLEHFSYSAEALVLAGVAETPEQVAAFLRRVDSADDFTAVELVDLKRDAGDARAPCRFSVKARFLDASGSQA